MVYLPRIIVLVLISTSLYAAPRTDPWNWQDVQQLSSVGTLRELQLQLNQFDDTTKQKAFANDILLYLQALKSHPTLNYKPDAIAQLEIEALAAKTGFNEKFFADAELRNFLIANDLFRHQGVIGFKNGDLFLRLSPSPTDEVNGNWQQVKSLLPIDAKGKLIQLKYDPTNRNLGSDSPTPDITSQQADQLIGDAYANLEVDVARYKQLTPSTLPSTPAPPLPPPPNSLHPQQPDEGSPVLPPTPAPSPTPSPSPVPKPPTPTPPTPGTKPTEQPTTPPSPDVTGGPLTLSALDSAVATPTKLKAIQLMLADIAEGKAELEINGDQIHWSRDPIPPNAGDAANAMFLIKLSELSPSTRPPELNESILKAATTVKEHFSTRLQALDTPWSNWTAKWAALYHEMKVQGALVDLHPHLNQGIADMNAVALALAVSAPSAPLHQLSAQLDSLQNNDSSRHFAEEAVIYAQALRDRLPVEADTTLLNEIQAKGIAKLLGIDQQLLLKDPSFISFLAANRMLGPNVRDIIEIQGDAPALQLSQDQPSPINGPWSVIKGNLNVGKDGKLIGLRYDASQKQLVDDSGSAATPVTTADLEKMGRDLHNSYILSHISEIKLPLSLDTHLLSKQEITFLLTGIGRSRLIVDRAGDVIISDTGRNAVNPGVHKQSQVELANLLKAISTNNLSTLDEEELQQLYTAANRLQETFKSEQVMSDRILTAARANTTEKNETIVQLEQELAVYPQQISDMEAVKEAAKERFKQGG